MTALPHTAYDLLVLAEAAREQGERHHGWCFGLPPGIQPEEWPLDPANGWPLMHGFTLLLPEDYRPHGPEIVAISFFGPAPDHNDGGPMANPAVETALAQTTAPADPALRAVWNAFQHRHPRLHRMKDILDCSYAVILLTQQEFDGPFCRPAPVAGPALAGVAAPEWLTKGAAEYLGNLHYSPHPQPPTFPEGLPDPDGQFAAIRRDQIERVGLGFNRALRLLPRVSDPNAGKTPEERWDDEPGESGYRSFFYWLDGTSGVENYREHDWAKGHQVNHLGGTMRPCQAIPEGIGPFYVEFEDYLGGFNFGGGNAQLDFKNMIFDWACG